MGLGPWPSDSQCPVLLALVVDPELSMSPKQNQSELFHEDFISGSRRERTLPLPFESGTRVGRNQGQPMAVFFNSSVREWCRNKEA